MMSKNEIWLGLKRLASVLGQLVSLLVGGIALFIAVLIGISFLQVLYAPARSYNDFLSATTVLISGLAFLVAAIFGYRSVSILHDEYQPMPSVTYENLPPKRFPETIVNVTNVGKRNLHLSSAIVTSTWFPDKISPTLEVRDIAPGEEVPLVVVLQPPLPGLHTLRIELSDEENDKLWKKVKVFRVEQQLQMAVTKAPPDPTGDVGGSPTL